MIYAYLSRVPEVLVGFLTRKSYFISSSLTRNYDVSIVK